MKRNVRVAVAALIGVIALAACGSSGGSTSSGNGEADTTSTTAASATSSTTAPGAKDTLHLGKVIAGADGKVLYLYTPDGTAEVSTVPAAVLQAWPPVVVKVAPTVGTGLDASKVGTGTQPSGAKWVRYNGHLLYGFTGDASPGDINGNGISGVWHAVNASGDAIMS
jgi:predicted lipoprotein with Yx(FWY)xxD motif